MELHLWNFDGKKERPHAGELFRVGPHVGVCVFHIGKWYLMYTRKDMVYKW